MLTTGNPNPDKDQPLWMHAITCKPCVRGKLRGVELMTMGSKPIYFVSSPLEVKKIGISHVFTLIDNLELHATHNEWMA